MISNRAAFFWIIALVTFLLIVNSIRGAVIRAQKARVVVDQINLKDKYHCFELNPKGWIQVKAPQGRYRYSCPEGVKIRLPNGAEIINSHQRYDRLGDLDLVWLKGSGKARFSRID